MILEEIQAEIQKMRDAGLSYGDIGKCYDLNKGIIYRVLNEDYEPKRKDIRHKLGLGDRTVEFIFHARNEKGRFTAKNHVERGR